MAGPNGTDKQPLSAARRARLRCPGNTSKEHCFHSAATPWQPNPQMPPQIQEYCCQCSPHWLRIVIPVKGLTETLIKVMNDHPIYHFEDMSQARQQSDAQGEVRKLWLPN